MAKEFGILDVDRLADSLTEQQVLEWMAVGIIDGWAGMVIKGSKNKGLTPSQVMERLSRHGN